MEFVPGEDAVDKDLGGPIEFEIKDHSINDAGTDCFVSKIQYTCTCMFQM